MKIITIVGARPQFVKSAMLSKAICKHNLVHPETYIEENLLHTGQHYDYELSEIFFKELSLLQPKWKFDIAESVERMKEEIIPILKAEMPDFVIVFGDTNSTAAGAMAAHECGIKLAHIEAGLRSFNNSMPEEKNRILTDRLSTILYCPTKNAVQNLAREGIVDNVFNVGDIMYDTALFFGKQAFSNEIINERYILATIHRQENTDYVDRLGEIIKALSQIDYLVLWPIHPRTSKAINQNIALKKAIGKSSNIKIMKPQSYIKMMNLEKNADIIITDSGGVQKEAYFHRVPCITARNETEWIETVEKGWNVLTGANTQAILNAVANVARPDTVITEYGDGHTADKIVKHLIEF